MIATKENNAPLRRQPPTLTTSFATISHHHHNTARMQVWRFALAVLALGLCTVNLMRLQRVTYASVYVVIPVPMPSKTKRTTTSSGRDAALLPRKLSHLESKDHDQVVVEQQQHNVSFGDITTTATTIPTKQTNERHVALCAIVKSEEAYLHEWVDYHAALGVTHFYLYDNIGPAELVLQPQDLLTVDNKEVQISIQHWPGAAQQSAAYRDCAIQLQRAQKSLSSSPYWVGFLDVDEFVVLNHHDTLPKFLQDHCPTGAVSMNWALMGSSGQQVYRPLPVTQRFQDRVASVKGRHYEQLIKTFARIQDIKTSSGALFNAHFVSLQNGFHRVDTNGSIQPTHSRRNTNITDIDDNDSPPPTALVYHYRSKSAAEYQEKFAKGRSGSRADNATWVAQQQRLAELGKDWMEGDVHDSVVWDTLKERKPLYRVFDEPLREAKVPQPRSTSTTEVHGAAICATTLQTGDAAYIDEWVDYHRTMGFSNLFLWDATPRRELEQWANESAAVYGDSPTITWRRLKTSWRDLPQQAQLRQQQMSCVRMAREQGYQWLVMLEVDQFLVLRNQSHILDFMDSIPLNDGAPGLGISQCRFGTAKQRVYTPKPVTQRFQYRDEKVESSNLVKILNLQAARNSLDKDDDLVHVAEHEAVVHHYATRSIKEYLVRQTGDQVLGDKSAVKRILREDTLVAGSVHDDAAWIMMKQMNPRYAIYDKL